jgi:nucleoside-diphosphate-sugar epimerase
MGEVMKVLVVGGAGYIGGAVTDWLKARLIPFTVYDNLFYEPHYLKPVSFIRGDIRDKDLLGRIMHEYSHVIWLAALVGDGACQVKPSLTQAINTDSIAWFAKRFEGKIIFTSTCSVYGEHEGLVDETGVTNPLSLYAQTKLEAEGYLLQRGDSLIFRLGTAFGLSDNYSRPRMDLVANQMPVTALTKGVINLNGGEQWRPMIHVRDIARTIVENLNRGETGIYNLATENVQIKKIAEACAKITKCKVNVTPMNSVDARNYRANIEKAKRDHIFSTHFNYTIEDGILQFVELIRSKRIADLSSGLYFNVRHVEEMINAGKIA